MGEQAEAEGEHGLSTQRKPFLILSRGAGRVLALIRIPLEQFWENIGLKKSLYTCLTIIGSKAKEGEKEWDEN
jgi:hypothetical protein